MAERDDTRDAPRMVELAPGSFEMGSDFHQSEGPIRTVRIGAFAISQSEVTVAQYRGCVEAGACREPGTGELCNWDVSGRGEHPVNCVSWDDAKKYADWLGVRLPTEAEWEYAARSEGRDILYPWGNREPNCTLAMFDGCHEGTRPVCSVSEGFSAQGLCEISGNVWEWIEDDWHDDYRGAPLDGIARAASPRGSSRGMRGGSWDDDPLYGRATNRDWGDESYRHDDVGFRVATSVRD